jgi:hypothetical protein
LLTELDNQALRFPGRLTLGRLPLADEHERGPDLRVGQQLRTIHPDRGPDAARRPTSPCNYGTGTPEEAAAWVKYANKVNCAQCALLGSRQRELRQWEADNNTRPHDPGDVRQRVQGVLAADEGRRSVDQDRRGGDQGEDAYANYTEQQVTNPRTGAVHNGWTPVLLDTLRQLGVTPDFVVYHRYEQAPGGESDLFLLDSAASWGNDAAQLRQMLDDYLGRSRSRSSSRSPSTTPCSAAPASRPPAWSMGCSTPMRWATC